MGILNLKKLRKQNGLSQQKLADDLGVSRSAVAMWETSSSEPDTETLIALAKHFHVSLEELVTQNDSALAPSVPGAKLVPVLGRIAAGVPIEAVQEILDYEEISPQMALQGDHFALRVSGHSMEPKISDGDVVIVRKQDDADNGDICVVFVNSDDATVKRIKKEAGGIWLMPNNPAYETKFYSAADIENLPITILGRVVELRAKF